MSDPYQPIYDAVRSRLSHCNVNEAVENVVRDAFGNAGHQIACAFQNIDSYFHEYSTPFAVHKPRIAKDGDKWICCLGDNLQEGVVGIGDTPEKCAADFNANWIKP